jgi:hypothetical protein
MADGDRVWARHGQQRVPGDARRRAARLRLQSSKFAAWRTGRASSTGACRIGFTRWRNWACRHSRWRSRADAVRVAGPSLGRPAHRVARWTRPCGAPCVRRPCFPTSSRPSMVLLPGAGLGAARERNVLAGSSARAGSIRGHGVLRASGADQPVPAGAGSASITAFSLLRLIVIWRWAKGCSRGCR